MGSSPHTTSDRFAFVRLANGEVAQVVGEIRLNPDGTVVDLDNFIQKVKVFNQDDLAINTGNPFSVKNENLVVLEDVDLINSKQFSFVGDIANLFKKNASGLVDSTTNNPKQLDIAFDTPIISVATGLNTNTGTFSNVELRGIVSSINDTPLVDESLIDTDYDSRPYTYVGTGYGGIRLLFHTSDTVNITRTIITRAITTISQSLGIELEADKYLSQLLLNSASSNMAVTGSLANPVDFTYTVPAGKKVSLRRMLIMLKQGQNEFSSDNFAAINALTNGVDMRIVKNNGVEVPMELWFENADISLTMYDFANPYKDGTYIGRHSFDRDVGDFITLRQGDTFRIRIQDNLGSIVKFLSLLKGKIEDD